ncbi:MAG: hypothetical protein U5N55_10875 [Cypionkella sp.]|nr:hypothetical protein [Cypionkella sp.]
MMVLLLALAGAAMMLPAAHATIMAEHRVARGFFYTGIVVLIVAAMIAIASASGTPDRGLRAQLIAMVAGYGVLPLVFAMPLLQTHLGIGGSAAWFDMLAAFTTTGAALRYPEALPPRSRFGALWWVGWVGCIFRPRQTRFCCPLVWAGPRSFWAAQTNPREARILLAPLLRLID